MVAASKDTASTKQYFRDTAVRHTFNDRTGAIFHYSHVPLTYWFSTFCMVSWCGISIRSTSLQLGIPYRICYHMIKIIMERIVSLDNPKLDGIVEHDQLYVKSGMKGRNYHDGIIMERMPRRRGLKPPPGRGMFESDQPMILCCHQRGGRTVFNVPVNFEPLLSCVCNTVSYGSTVYTDEYLAYRKLKEYGFDHDAVCHGIRVCKGRCTYKQLRVQSQPLQILAWKVQGSQQVQFTIVYKDI